MLELLFFATFLVGAAVGVFLTSLTTAAKQADAAEEARLDTMKRARERGGR